MFQPTKALITIILTSTLLFGERIVGIGGSVSEAIVALGHKDNLVAVDLSSIYPPQLTDVPKIGYWLQLTTESILSLKPDVVIASELSKPTMVLDSLKDFGISTHLISDKPTIDSVYEKITHIGNVLHEEQKAQDIVTKLKTTITLMQEEIKRQTKKPKVLILFSQGANTLMAAGKTTKAGAMIEIAGGINGVNIDSFASISQESILAMNPDVVIFTNHNGVSPVNHTLVKLTDAQKNNRVYDMDMLLLSGFSVRSDEALKQLSCALYDKNLSYCSR